MAMDQAVKFLQEMRSNEKVKEFLQNVSEPADEDQAFEIYAEAAAFAGYEVTAQELKEASLSRKKALKEKSDAVTEDVEALEAEDLDQVAGGYYWAADDSPIDGHELFCMIFYHHIEWSVEHDDWCTKNYVFRDMYYKKYAKRK